MRYKDANDVIRNFRDEMRKIYYKDINKSYKNEEDKQLAIKEAKKILRNLRKFDY